MTYFYHEGANTWGYYEEITRKEKSNGDTTFTFSGLDDGYYKLEEPVVPKGFNGIDPIEFRIVANHITAINAASEVTLELSANSQIAGELNIVGEAVSGTVSANIENRSGTELPHTGGIGTTLFYILGSVLVAGAVVVLVPKKRMIAEG